MRLAFQVLMICIALDASLYVCSRCCANETKVYEEIRFAPIQAGEFMMGGSESDSLARRNERPRHMMTISKKFYLSETEVTVAQFRRFVESTDYITSAEQERPSPSWRYTPLEQSLGEFPVRNVSWYDAQAFCQWLNKSGEGIFRLPTEAEWEYACRAGSKTRYSFGDDVSKLEDHAWVGTSVGDDFPPGTEAWRGREREQPCKVRDFPQNEFGLFGMHGNVSEWTDTRYSLYQERKSDEEENTNAMVIRGGNYDVAGPVGARCSYRSWMHKRHFNNFVGFRIVWEPQPDSPRD